MTRSQYCREHIDKVAEMCGLERSTVSDVKQAAAFCDEYSDLSECSTRAIMALIRIRDDSVREKAISSIEKSFKSGKHPLTGLILKKKVLTEREVKAIINRADMELRKELMKDSPPEREMPSPPAKPAKKILCMYYPNDWKEGDPCNAPSTILEKCDETKRNAKNCPIPIQTIVPDPGPPQRLTTEYCRSRNCPHIKKREMNNTLECELTEKVPGNMIECPIKDAPKPKASEPNEFLLRQISKCRQKRCPELVDDETTTLCKVMEAYAEKGTPWCRYDCPKGQMNTDPEIYTGSRITGEAFARSEECRSAVVKRSSSPQAPSGNVTFTIYAGRHEMATVRNMLKYGDALDEDEAAQTMFKDGASLWLDKMERRVQEDGIGDMDE